MIRSGVRRRTAALLALGAAVTLSACASGDETLSAPEVYDPTDLRSVAVEAYSSPEAMWDVMTEQCRTAVALVAGGQSAYIDEWHADDRQIEVIGAIERTGAVTYVEDGAEKSQHFIQDEDGNWLMECGEQD